MSLSDDLLYVVLVFVLCVLGAVVVKVFCRRSYRRKRLRNRVRNQIRTINTSNQQDDIYNISSRVQGQGQWPTHDAHVSLDSFTINNETNKYNDEPPTYEEAMHIAALNSLSTAPKTITTTVTTTTSTTSASAI